MTKGAKGRADRLWSELIRSRGMCERCGAVRGQFDAAHIIRRARQGTRCDPLNGWCLCRRCHGIVDMDGNRNPEYLALVDRTIGVDGFTQLQQKANDAECQRIPTHEWETIADGLAGRLRR